MSGLAYIGKVVDIRAIPNAERVEQAEVVCGKGGKWLGVVVKGQFAIGDLCRVFLQDSQLPEDNTEFAFMAKRHYIVHMARFLGVPSECLILPLRESFEVGTDISEFERVLRYSKPLPANISGMVRGNFPNFIPKTDELNFQSARYLVDALRGSPYVATVKCDGCSSSAYKYQDHFGMCSRNLELKETPENALWQIARRYDLENKLPEGIAIQWETVGPGIQKNPMGEKVITPYLFNVWDIVTRRYYSPQETFDFAKSINVPHVPIACRGDAFQPSEDELRAMAEGKYPNGKQREGIVIRPEVEMRVGNIRLSFKVINLLYRGE